MVSDLLDCGACTVVPNCYLNVLWKRLVCQPRLNNVPDFIDRLVLFDVYSRKYRRNAVQFRMDLIVGKTIRNGCDFSECNDRPVQFLDQRDAFELFTRGAFRNGVKNDIAGVGFQFSER